MSRAKDLTMINHSPPPSPTELVYPSPRSIPDDHGSESNNTTIASSAMDDGIEERAWMEIAGILRAMRRYVNRLVRRHFAN
jgi:hypothetical protein